MRPSDTRTRQKKDKLQQARNARDQRERPGDPERQRVPGNLRLQQHEFAVARHDIADHLLVAVARHDAFSHQEAQVARQVGIGIVDRLVLADHAAQIGRKIPRPLLQLRIGKLLARIDGERRKGREEES